MEMADAVVKYHSQHMMHSLTLESRRIHGRMFKLLRVVNCIKRAQKNAMLQLTQGLASGQLQGDEFRSIAENAPMIEICYLI